METTVKRGPGRPPKNPPVTTTPTGTTTAPVSSYAPPDFSIPDSELENYGGDVAAHDSVGKRGRIARHTDYAPGSIGFFLPDLNPPGMLVNKHNPDAKFHFAYWDDDGTVYSRQMFSVMTRKGYRPATSDDWYVHPDIRTAILPDDNLRLTFAASKAGGIVVMYQSEADYRRDRKELTRVSDDIQKTAEEKAATMQEDMRRGGLDGIRSTSTLEDDFDAATEYRR